jgi:hypothetical protein
MKKTTKKTSAPAVSPVTANVPATHNAVTHQSNPTASSGLVKAAPARSQSVTSAAPVTIVAKIDVGFGNKLFVRGQGEGLSWERGIPLENVDSRTWRLTVPAKDKLQFKLLLNDTVWAKGDDVIAAPGKHVQVSPAF